MSLPCEDPPMMPLDSSTFADVSRAAVLTPAMQTIWESMGVGVAVVDGEGICRFMNTIQRRVDGFSRISVVGRHITSLYVPHELECIPTIECLRKGEPILKKAYWYKTTNNYLASTVTDFIPLYDAGRKDGVIAFTIWTGTTAFAEGRKRQPRPPQPKGAAYDFYTFDSIVGQDANLREVIAEARTAAATSSPVMIWGESGTGKEVFAQAIHSESDRRQRPFIPVNCAAIPENLLEGILFGTVKGAYTDAADKPGLFEEADGGTLLFDELNSMPLGLQAKLLRVLQEKRVRRLGSHTEVPVDVRIMSILNEEPLQAVEHGVLRRDLFYRLAVVGISVPPLRERRNDIPLLARMFIDRSELATRPGGPGTVGVNDDVLHMFMHYDWPGNIRELLHVVEGSLALLGDGPEICPACLPRHFREACHATGSTPATVSDIVTQAPTLPAPAAAAGETGDAGLYYDYRNIRKSHVVPLKGCLQKYETQCISNVLRVTGGNVAKAARIMQVTGAGLRYKMKALDISDED